MTMLSVGLWWLEKATVDKTGVTSTIIIDNRHVYKTHVTAYKTDVLSVVYSLVP